MLTTKEFADLCKTTKRTIIHYDQIDLLKPTTKKRLNRFYTPQQVLRFEKISLLQSLGFSLNEIRQSLNSHQSLMSIFIDNKQKIAKQQKKINDQMNKVNELLHNLEHYKSLIAPQIKLVEQYNFYGIEKKGKYAEIPKFCDELEKTISDPQENLTYLIIFNDYGYFPVHAEMIVGVVNNNLLPQSIKIKQFYSHSFTALTYTHVGPHSYLGYLWDFLEEHVRKNKLTLDPINKVREIYIKGPANEKHEENYITEIQIPIIV